MAVLEVNDVSVRYLAGDFRDIGIKDYIIRKLKGTWDVERRWADRHVTFSLEKGDALGIIGGNGSGKSTLLKAITGVLPPAEGRVRCHGNIGAILEVASGFDSHMTVLENIYLRGAILGRSRKMMDLISGNIISFAGLEGFEGHMFGALSSGMKSRLAFSIAVMAKPDVLVLDEVFSVGDVAFREQSRAKIKEAIGNGTVVLMVSHSLDEIEGLCTKALWLNKGEMTAFGDVHRICGQYRESLKVKEEI